MAALDNLDEEALEILYDRTQAIVQRVDADGDGSADVAELTRFFGHLHSVSGQKGEPPEDEALAIIEGVGDGSVVQLDELCEILMETFAEDVELLDEIEALLEEQDEQKTAAVDESLNTAWKASASVRADDCADDGDGDIEDDVATKENTIAACHETSEAVMEHVSDEVDLEVRRHRN